MVVGLVPAVLFAGKAVNDNSVRLSYREVVTCILAVLGFSSIQDGEFLHADEL